MVELHRCRVEGGGFGLERIHVAPCQAERGAGLLDRHAGPLVWRIPNVDFAPAIAADWVLAQTIRTDVNSRRYLLLPSLSTPPDTQNFSSCSSTPRALAESCLRHMRRVATWRCRSSLLVGPSLIMSGSSQSWIVTLD